MKILHITVRDKIATYSQRDGAIICGNDDYQVQFALDSEWEGVPAKARFVWNGKHEDKPIVDGIAAVPRIVRAREVKVGVYSEDESLQTTTAALIPCDPSILCDTTAPTEGNEAHYASEAQEAAERAEAAAERAEAAGGGGGGGGGDSGLTEEDEERVREIAGEFMTDVEANRRVRSVDLSRLDTEGKIVETYAGGWSETFSMEFDAAGNPVKITDQSGNETVLVW